MYISISTYAGPGGLTQKDSLTHEELQFYLSLTPRRLHSRKILFTVDAPLHLILPHTLILYQTPDAPLTQGHRVIATALTHDINQLRRWHDVRLHFVPRLRPLLVRIRIPDQTGFAPGCAEEAEPESVFFALRLITMDVLADAYRSFVQSDIR